MAVISIPDETADQSFSVGAAPTTGPWSFLFSYFAKEDLQVAVDDVRLEQTDFTVVGNDVEGGFKGGTLTLNAEVSNCTVRIYRSVKPVRTDNFSPAPFATMQDIDVAFNRLVAMVQDISRMGVSAPTTGGSGGGTTTTTVSWADILSKPTIFNSDIAHVTGLQAALDGKSPVGHTHLSVDITDLTEAVQDIVGGFLTAGSNVTVGYNDAGNTLVISAAGGGTGQKPVLLSSFGAIDGGGVNTASNDTAFTGAQAGTDSAIYVPGGTYKTTKTASFLTKLYLGRGQIVTGDATPQQLPANFSYLASNPTTYAGTGTGVGGWFSGDQQFTNQEYKIIGSNILTYDPVRTTYFQSAVIPNSAFFDVNSGNSGVQAWLTSGAVVGQTTINIHAAPSAEWVGKTVMFAATMDGAWLESRTVTGVGPGNTITVSPGLGNSYTWNPTAGQKPCIMFAHRTWTGHKYIKVNDNAGGDVYGHLVNMTIKYQPKASETHTFMAGTAGQYGGNITFASAGVYATGWESQYNDNGYDVAAIAQVDSFNRTKDDSLTGGTAWIGTKFQSGGTRPADVAHAVSGPWRYGLDTAYASLIETARLVDPTISGGASIKVTDLNGAIVGFPVTIGDAGQYSGTITAINTGSKTITVSPALPGSVIGAGTIVRYTRGGAIINAALGQRIVFNSTVSNNARGGDPLGCFSPFYGNVQGDIEMGTETDGFGDYWYVRFNGNNPSHNGGTVSRLRLRPNNLAYNLDLQVGGAISAANGMTTNGGYGGTGEAMLVFKAGSGNFIIFDSISNQFKFFKNNTVVWTI